MRKRRHLAFGMFATWLSVVTTGVVFSQDYPNRPIRMVTAGAGSTTDFLTRITAQGISGSLGQPVIVDNRASGVIPGQIVSQSKPDGYTLLAYANTTWIAPLLEKTTYEAARDLAPISLISKTPLILVVHPSLPVKSVTELIDLARAKSGQLNYSAGGIGGVAHLSGELFKAKAGLNIVHVPYKIGSQELAALIAGETQFAFGGGAQYMPSIRAGKLRAIAVTSAQPSSVFPGMPTMASAGLTGFDVISVTAILAPAKTPVSIVSRLNEEIVRVINSAEVKEKFSNNGVEAAGSTPKELETLIRVEITTFGKLVKDLGLAQ